MATTNQTWTAAFDAYSALRAASDALADDHPDCDRAVDAYCAAMDALLAIPAPDHAAVLTKIDLIAERYQDFAIGPDYWQTVREDVARLGGEASPCA